MIERLGKYEIKRLLGRGAMGEVYLAHHPIVDRDVAIKTILKTAAMGDGTEERFRREAAAAGKLSHANLVTIFDFDKDGDTLYLVMEYVKGDDLEDLIKRRSLSQSESLELLAQICDGLGFAHRSGILHRDIKPTNVRVLRDGQRLQAKIMDFGIARVEDSSLTATGIVVGTVSYLAPEYIQSGKSTAQGDLWAVGVMLYECLSGRKPFEGNNATTILFKIVSEAPKPLEIEEIVGISPSIREVLHRALAKDPSQRFGSADELAKALRACKDPGWIAAAEDHTALIDRSRSAAPAEATVKVLSKPPQVAPKRPLVWLAVAGVALLALGGLGWQVIGARMAARPSAGTSASAPSAAARPVSRYPLGMSFASIPAGAFRMGGGLGERDEKPIHEVTLSRPFRLQTTPVTVAQFRAFVDATGYHTDAETLGKAWARNAQTNAWDETEGINWRQPGFAQEEACPVICVTWRDAQAFLDWLNRQDPGKGYRLPTEAEWEYACRAGSQGARYGALDAIAWYQANSGLHTHPVGLKAANAFGLFDMLGNAWQWCQDGYGPYSDQPVTDPLGDASAKHRVLRGGSWFSAEESCHSAGRTKGTVDSRGNYVGFRVACTG